MHKCYINLNNKSKKKKLDSAMSTSPHEEFHLHAIVLTAHHFAPRSLYQQAQADQSCAFGISQPQQHAIFL